MTGRGEHGGDTGLERTGCETALGAGAGAPDGPSGEVWAGLSGEQSWGRGERKRAEPSRGSGSNAPARPSIFAGFLHIHCATHSSVKPLRCACVHSSGSENWIDEIPLSARWKSPGTFRCCGVGVCADTTMSMEPFSRARQSVVQLASSRIGGETFRRVSPSSITSLLSAR